MSERRQEKMTQGQGIVGNLVSGKGIPNFLSKSWGSRVIMYPMRPKIKPKGNNNTKN